MILDLVAIDMGGNLGFNVTAVNGVNLARQF